MFFKQSHFWRNMVMVLNKIIIENNKYYTIINDADIMYYTQFDTVIYEYEIKFASKSSLVL